MSKNRVINGQTTPLEGVKVVRTFLVNTSTCHRFYRP